MNRVSLQIIAERRGLDEKIRGLESVRGLRRNPLTGPVQDDVYMGSEDLITFHVEFFYDNDSQLEGIVDGLVVLDCRKKER